MSEADVQPPGVYRPELTKSQTNGVTRSRQKRPLLRYVKEAINLTS